MNYALMKELFGFFTIGDHAINPSAIAAMTTTYLDSNQKIPRCKILLGSGAELTLTEDEVEQFNNELHALKQLAMQAALAQQRGAQRLEIPPELRRKMRQ